MTLKLKYILLLFTSSLPLLLSPIVIFLIYLCLFFFYFVCDFHAYPQFPTQAADAFQLQHHQSHPEISTAAKKVMMQTMRPTVVIEKSKCFDVVSTKPPVPPSKGQVALVSKSSSISVASENGATPVVNSKPVVMIFKKPPTPLARIARKNYCAVNFVATSVTAKPATATQLTWYLYNNNWEFLYNDALLLFYFIH